MKNQFNIRKYYVIVFSIILIGCSNDDKDITIPSEVLNLTGTSGEEQVILSWDKGTTSDVKEYWLTVSPLVFDAFVVDKNLETITVKNLKGGTKYTFSLLVKNTSGGVSKGISVSVTPTAIDRKAPAEVTNLTAIPDDKKIKLNWIKPKDSDLVGYELSYEPGGGNVKLGKDIEAYTIEGLTNGTTYNIVLKTKDQSNNISVGNSIKATPTEGDNVPPAEATDFNFSGDFTALKFTMSWNNPSDTDFQESELTYYYDPAKPTTIILDSTKKSIIIDGIYEQNYTLILKTKDKSGNYSTGVTKKIRFGNFGATNHADINAFDNNTIAILAGKLKIGGADITDLSKFSNLVMIEGKLEIVNNTSLTNLDAFNKLKLISAKVTITGNTKLSNFCGLKNVINAGGLSGGTSISGNASNPTTQNILDNCN